MGLSLLFGFLTLTLVANQVATGLALTLLGLGLSGLIGEGFVGQPGVKLAAIHIPGLTDIPFIGRILFGQDPLVYVSLVLTAAVSYVLFRTRPASSSAPSATTTSRPMRSATASSPCAISA